MKLSKTQQHILETIEQTKKHVFVSGKAGTGKSTLLQAIRKNTRKHTAVTAPTGIAAIHVGGETLHSFLGFKPGITPNLAHKLAKKCPDGRKKKYIALEMLIIDEVSMIRADFMDAVDTFLRVVRDSNIPFGGVQCVFIGDMYQLPPVVGYQEKQALLQLYETPFFFSASVFLELSWKTDILFHELTEIFRQGNDKIFVELLNEMRMGKLSAESLAAFNERCLSDPDLDKAILVTTTNAQAATMNEIQLENLSGPSLPYCATIEGDISPDLYPCPPILELKAGTRVMMCNNDPMGRWLNGSLGTIIHLDVDSIEVRLDNGRTHKIRENTWDIQKTVFNTESEELEQVSLGKYQQYPIQYAWAITIHKSQGKTFDRVHIDLGRGAFAHGQVYVAMSRAQKLEDITLASPLRQRDIIFMREVQEFSSYLNLIHNSNQDSVIDHAITQSKVLLVDLGPSGSRTLIPTKREKQSLNGFCPMTKKSLSFNLENITSCVLHEST